MPKQVNSENTDLNIYGFHVNFKTSKPKNSCEQSQLFEGTEYIVLIENDEDADEVVILQINQIDEETEEYVSIDDEDTLNKVFELFKKKYEGDINFE